MTKSTPSENELTKSSLYTGPKTLLHPRPEVMRAWLNYWFEFVAGSIEIAWRDPTIKKITNAAHFDLRDPRLESYAAEVNSVEGQDTYFTPSIVSNLRGRAKDSDFVCSPGFWLDQDKPADIDYANTVQHEFYATSFVHTGRTPDPRRQCWFRLEQPVRDFALVRETNAKLVDLYKGDPSVINPARLMRLPGSIAYPWKPGRIPELVSWDHPQDQRHRSHPISLVTTIPEMVPTLIEHRPKSAFPGVEELINRIKAGNNWHSNMVQLVGHWVARGLSDAEILVWADQFTLRGYTSEETVDEMQVAIDGGRKSWDVPNHDHEAMTGLQSARAAFADEFTDELIRHGVSVSGEEYIPRYQRIGNIQPDTAPHLWDGIIRQRTVCELYAPPYVGKTILAAHIAFSVAQGLPCMGRDCTQGGVYFVESEGIDLLADNLRALFQAKGVDINSAPIGVSDEYLNLLDPDSVRSTIYDIKHFAARNGGCSLVIIDTLSQSIAGKDENTQAVMSEAVKQIALAGRVIGAAALIIHHTGKDESAGSRGSNVLPANIHSIVNLSRANNGLVKMEPEKFKGGRLAMPEFFKIEEINLRVDHKGRAVGAGIAVHVAVSDAKAALRQSSLLPSEKAVIDALEDGQESGWVHKARLREKFNLRYVSTSAKPKTRNTAFSRALKSLISASLISPSVDGKQYRITLSHLSSREPAEIPSK